MQSPKGWLLLALACVAVPAFAFLAHWLQLRSETQAQATAEIKRDCGPQYYVTSIDLREGSATMSDGCNTVGAMRDWQGHWSTTYSTMVACEPTNNLPPEIRRALRHASIPHPH